MQPEGLGDLGDDVWIPNGIKMLGTPLGNADFVTQHVQRRIADEAKLWDAIPEIPDLQCAWRVLL